MSNRVKGFSLVELLITLVISLVAILSMLSLYQGIGRNNAEAKQGARLDGQIQIALLTAHKHLQGAGFTVNGDQASSYSSDLQLISGAELNKDNKKVSSNSTMINIAQDSTGSIRSSTTGWALLWRSRTSLAGLYAPKGGGLYSLSGTGTTLSWADDIWTIDSPLIKLPEPVPASFEDAGKVHVQLNRTTCHPLGNQIAGLPGGAYSVTLAVTGYAAAATRTSSTCLINTR